MQKLEELVGSYNKVLEFVKPLGYFVDNTIPPQVDLTPSNHLSSITNFYLRHHRQLDEIAVHCLYYLFEVQPWGHPTAPCLFVEIFAEKFMQSDLFIEAKSDPGLSSSAAHYNPELITRYLPRLLAFQTGVYKSYASQFSSSVQESPAQEKAEKAIEEIGE